MKIEKIKPIPKYIIAKIKQRETKIDGYTRYYAYLTTNDKELVKVTVAVKYKRKKMYYKQCAVHGIHSEKCFVKDMVFNIISGYSVGWYFEGLANYQKWYESVEWGTAEDKYFDPYAPIINEDFIAKFPEYKYSAYKLYSGVDILQYLRIYEKYPQAEYILKLGLSEYVKSKQILEKCKKDKRFCKWLSNNRIELRTNQYYISTILKAYQKKKPLSDTQVYEQAKKMLCKETAFKPIREMLGGEYERYIDYIKEKQITNRLYLDYLNACNYLGLDMTEEKNRYPHNFNQWHDIRIDEYNTAKALKDKEERQELYTKFALVADKYSPLQYDKKSEFVVVIAKSPEELIKEGETLHHCVGRMNYDQKFIREETLIFFIRPFNNPEQPFVTAEYSLTQKKVLQCYAQGNSKPNDEVMEYVNNIWLPYANKTLKRISV